MQTAGIFVSALAEFPAGMQISKHQLDGGHPPLRLAVVIERSNFFVYRNAAAVVADGNRAVDVHGDFDLVARSGEVFVDRIVENFKNHVMQATLIRVADVHPRALANGLEAFQFVDLRSVVFLCRSDSGHLLVGQFLNRNLFLSLNHI